MFSIYKRPVANCSVGALDLGKALVVQGLAVPFAKYSNVYIPEGDKAKLDRVGPWNTKFEMPWDFQNEN